ncbi:uncharacterized protein LOC107371760 [Tetranychus urticae]|nr:uncharacterized protein LOC107371760 [Tetranychus urticae]
MFKILEHVIQSYEEDLYDDKIDTKDAFIIICFPDRKEIEIEQASTLKQDLEVIKDELRSKKPVQMMPDRSQEQSSFICFYGSFQSAKKFGLFASQFFSEDLDEQICDPILTPEIQITTISSSQDSEISENLTQSQAENILEKLEQIKDLVDNVKASLTKNKRKKTKKTQDQGAKRKKVPGQQVLENYGYFRKQSIRKPIIPSKTEEPITHQRLRERFNVSLFHCRQDLEWTSNIKKFTIEGIQSDIMEGIRNHLIRGNALPGYFVRKVARLMFGDKRLMETKILDPEKKFGGVKRKNRMKVFSDKEEKNLLLILSQIDKELFESKDGWHILVRNPINQLGLDLRGGKVKIQDESEPVAGPSAINLDQNEQDLDENDYVIEDDSG